MSKLRQCFLFLLFLTTSIAFWCELAVPLFIYLHISTIREGVIVSGNLGNASIADISIQQEIDDNIPIFICLAGIAMFLICVIILTCKKLRILNKIPRHVKEEILREKYFNKLMEKKVIAELNRMRAQGAFSPPPEGKNLV
ncbi:unnamed protein product [Nezara viridula]|uniref:Neuropeptide n=1 Tax=Nezara viridula TaxID=85310 RepID=A0A9P0HK29_NEZVI|nr:unnamed protein product [Nezara viridula]